RDIAATLALDVAVEHRAPGIPGLRLGTARKRGYANRRRDRKYENRSHCGTLRTVAPGFLRRNESRTSPPGQQGNKVSTAHSRASGNPDAACTARAPPSFETL